MLEIPNEIDWIYTLFAANNDVTDHESVVAVNESIVKIHNHVKNLLDENIDSQIREEINKSRRH